MLKSSVLVPFLLVLMSACAGDDAGNENGDVQVDESAATEAPAVEAPAAPGPLTAADQEALQDPCSLLEDAELQRITGRQDYGEGTKGDELGEGAGGGTSCQWSTPAFGGAGESAPMISLIVVPPRDGRRWTEGVRNMPRSDCTYAAATAAGPGAFFENCPRAATLPLYIPARALDVIVGIDLAAPTTAETARPLAEQVGSVVVAKLK
jgi:hypothetical protein